MTRGHGLAVATITGLAAAGAFTGAWVVFWTTTEAVGDALEFLATTYAGNH